MVGVGEVAALDFQGGFLGAVAVEDVGNRVTRVWAAGMAGWLGRQSLAFALDAAVAGEFGGGTGSRVAGP